MFKTAITIATLGLSLGRTNGQMDQLLGMLAPSEIMGLGAGAASSLIGTLESKVSGVASLVGNLLQDTTMVAGIAGTAAANGLSTAAASVDTLYQAYRAEYCSPPLFAPGRLVPANMSTPGFSLTFSLGNCDLSLGDRSLECVAPYVRYRQTPAVLTGPHVRPGFFVGETCRAAAAFGTPQRNILFVLDPKKPRDMPSPSELAGLVADEVVNVFTDAAAGAGGALGAAFPAGAVPALFGGPGGGAATSTAVVGGGDGAATTSAGGR